MPVANDFVYCWDDSAYRVFTQRDPAGFRGGINLYLYTGQNPANFTDPMGLSRCSNNRIQLELSAYSAAYDAWFYNSRSNGLQWGPISNVMANFTDSPVCFDYADSLLSYFSNHVPSTCCQASLDVRGPTLGWVHARVKIECRNDCNEVVQSRTYDPWWRYLF